ncbi:MAG: hypothetical protein ACM3NR_04195 [Methanosarcina sp.]
MKTSAYILFAFLLLLNGCKKDSIRTSGSATINNLRYNENSTYAVHGFSFSKASIVSTESQPGPDITVDINSNYLIFMSNNLNPSFFKYDEYTSEGLAGVAFRTLDLNAFTFSQPSAIGGPILPNQIWIYKSGKDTYAKIRIISTKIEKRENLGQMIDFGECTFEWAYQPDGSLTFP